MAGSRLLPVSLGIVALGALVMAVAIIGRSSNSSAVAVWPPPTTAPASPTLPTGDGLIKVSIAGAVRQPGVYSIKAGDRVADLIAAAGGPAEDADTLALNQAQRLKDEDHVVVPRQGQAVSAAPSGVVSNGQTGGARTNLNTANARALEALPGIGAARAQRIIDSRTRDGLFAQPADLVTRKLVPQAVFDKLKDLVEVR